MVLKLLYTILIHEYMIFIDISIVLIKISIPSFEGVVFFYLFKGCLSRTV